MDPRGTALDLHYSGHVGVEGSIMLCSLGWQAIFVGGRVC